MMNRGAFNFMLHNWSSCGMADDKVYASLVIFLSFFFFHVQIKAFHKQRVAEMKSSLTQLARSELESARRMKETLTEALERMRRFETPLK